MARGNYFAELEGGDQLESDADELLAGSTIDGGPEALPGYPSKPTRIYKEAELRQIEWRDRRNLRIKQMSIEEAFRRSEEAEVLMKFLRHACDSLTNRQAMMVTSILDTYSVEDTAIALGIQKESARQLLRRAGRRVWRLVPQDAYYGLSEVLIEIFGYRVYMLSGRE